MGELHGASDGPGDRPESAPRPLRIGLVGHCGPDAWYLKGLVGRVFPGGEIAMIGDGRGATREAGKADLLLVNRALDGDFDEASGVELIGALAGVADRRAALMLVSNFADAQARAEALGAAPGFGKSGAGSPETARRMRAAVEGRVTGG